MSVSLLLYCPGRARPQVAIRFRENGGNWANLFDRLFPDVSGERGMGPTLDGRYWCGVLQQIELTRYHWV